MVICQRFGRCIVFEVMYICYRKTFSVNCYMTLNSTRSVCRSTQPIRHIGRVKFSISMCSTVKMAFIRFEYIWSGVDNAMWRLYSLRNRFQCIWIREIIFKSFSHLTSSEIPKELFRTVSRNFKMVKVHKMFHFTF